MTPEQIDLLTSLKEKVTSDYALKLSDITDDLSDGTLLYGYDVDRRTYHIYAQGGKMYGTIYTSRVVYEDKFEITTKFELARFVPNKRLYPEMSDFEFCKYLQEKEIPFTLTNYGAREFQTFYGRIS